MTRIYDFPRGPLNREIYKNELRDSMLAQNIPSEKIEYILAGLDKHFPIFDEGYIATFSLAPEDYAEFDGEARNKVDKAVDTFSEFASLRAFDHGLRLLNQIILLLANLYDAQYG